MTAKEFERKLKRLNPHLRVIPGPYKAWSVSVKRLFFDDETGEMRSQEHLCGMPSGRKFANLPKYDFIEEPAKLYGMQLGKSEYHRGWTKVLKLLIGKGELRRSDALREFGLVNL